MVLKLLLWCGLGLYAVLSAADLLLTSALLRLNPAAFESNPLAAAWLERHGWGGLAVYKALTVAVFIVAVMLLARRRRGVAVGVVGFGCTALLWVTIYSHGLLCQSHREATDRPDTSWVTPQATRPHDAGVRLPTRCWFAPRGQSGAAPQTASASSSR
jgi:hypothetical protein